MLCGCPEVTCVLATILNHCISQLYFIATLRLCRINLHYVLCGHGCHVSDNRDQKGINVRQHRGTGYVNIAGPDNRGHCGKFFDGLKICHSSHGRNEKHDKTG